MVFSSLVFLYAFLPLSLLCYVLVPGIRGKNTVLLLFSLLFYSWGAPIYLFLLLGMVAADWIIARKMEDSKRQGEKKMWLVTACAVNLGLIAIFKYLNLFDRTFMGIFGADPLFGNILLPIGISFYTFQLLSYVVDVYRGDVPAQKSYFTLLLYASLFHQCIAGPIVRYKDVSEELLSRHTNFREIGEGVSRFAVGLAKKTLLADVCGKLADELVGDMSVEVILRADSAAIWMSMLLFTLQIYLDFSAYSDMAIGMGRMIGLHYKENFNYPYIARSVKDFWRRWHISLSSFFRDYVYIPLGGSRVSSARTIFNLFVVWLLTGFWHGASWNFVLWGLYYFVFLTMERLFLGKLLDKIPHIIGRVYTWFVVFFGWTLFRFEDFECLKAAIAVMFGNNYQNPWITPETRMMLNGYLWFVIVAIVATTPLVSFLGKALRRKGEQSEAAATVYGVIQSVAPALLLLLSTAALVGEGYHAFLYYRF